MKKNLFCKWFGHKPDPKTIKDVDVVSVGYLWVSVCKRCGGKLTAFVLPEKDRDHKKAKA